MNVCVMFGMLTCSDSQEEGNRSSGDGIRSSCETDIWQGFLKLKWNALEGPHGNLQLLSAAIRHWKADSLTYWFTHWCYGRFLVTNFSVPILLNITLYITYSISVISGIQWLLGCIIKNIGLCGGTWESVTEECIGHFYLERIAQFLAQINSTIHCK